MFPSAPMHLFIPIVSIILFTLYLLLPMRIVVIFALAISSPPVPAETTKEKIDSKSVLPWWLEDRTSNRVRTADSNPEKKKTQQGSMNELGRGAKKRSWQGWPLRSGSLMML